MQTSEIVAATAILVVVPLLWGVLMGYGTDLIRRGVARHRKQSDE